MPFGKNSMEENSSWEEWGYNYPAGGELCSVSVCLLFFFLFLSRWEMIHLCTNEHEGQRSRQTGAQRCSQLLSKRSDAAVGLFYYTGTRQDHINPLDDLKSHKFGGMSHFSYSARLNVLSGLEGKRAKSRIALESCRRWFKKKKKKKKLCPSV